MRNFTSTFLFFVVGALMCVSSLSSQTTHAHSSTQQWKGIDLEAFFDTATENKSIYLYNVGTGKFVIEGGNWGMEARLFYEDFGRQMRLTPTRMIDSGITETNIASSKHYLICHIPQKIQGASWAQASKYSFTTIMDGAESYAKWKFRRVDGEDENSEYHTYYLYQEYNTNYYYSNDTERAQSTVRDFYLGAAYGEWCVDGTTTYEDGSTNNKGNGYYVHLDDDRACWTTAGQGSRWGAADETPPYENTTLVPVNGDNVPIQELYQWRVISEEEFERVLEYEVQGINPSISSLIPDRDFTRNADDFYEWWQVSPSTTTSAAGEGRYGYTWGNYKKLTKHSAGSDDNNAYYDQAWDAPVRLKKMFDNMKNAKLGFMSFEGIGTVSTTFTLPHAGWYQIEAAIISFAPPSHRAYMFAQAGGKLLQKSRKLRICTLIMVLVRWN